MKNISQYFSKGANNVIPYKWEEFSVEKPLRFDTNTLPFPPPNMSIFFQEMAVSCPINEYADPAYSRLKQLIANYEKVDSSMITITNSGDEAIDVLGKTFLNPGDYFLVTPPTYEIFTSQSMINKGLCLEIPLSGNKFELNADKIISESKLKKVKIIFLCNPNNPTASIVPNAVIEKILKDSKSIVVVDEAYREFYGKTSVPLLKKYSNLVILRSFSKFAALAGARIGYLLANRDLTQKFDAIRFPMGVSYLSYKLAEFVLEKDQKWIKEQVKIIKKEREYLGKELSKFGFKVYPSYSNFLLVEVGNKAGEICTRLKQKGIILRDRSNKKYLEGCVRITVRSREENNQLLKALREANMANNNFDGVIFDIDGVLIDVSKSYRQIIKETVEYMLKDKFNKKTSVLPEEIEEMKKIPGFNNDWDLSYALIKLLKTNTKKEDFKSKAKPVSEQIRKSKDYQKTKDIFQCFYLGQKLFLEIYKRKPSIVFKKGLIANEFLLLNLEILRLLSRKYKLGVATSRPRFEALFALKNLEITTKFIKEANIVAQEDVPKEKPAPDQLLEAKRRMRSKNPVYIGDSINDVIAAKKAGMTCIFIGNDLGDIQLSNINQIKEVLL